MNVIHSIAEMQRIADAHRSEGKRIGVVPTMGYLHRGHTSLIDIVRGSTDIVVTTIFVNPTQFAANEDFTKYPRNIERDTELAAEAGTTYLFVPEAAEMYPTPYHTYVSVEDITTVLEGRIRPTHFRGVTTIVAKLFNIIKPHVAIFGQKDAQQAVVINKMAKDLNFDVQIIVAPIIREPDGLAMSSRNVYLTETERREAPVLLRSLQYAGEAIANGERSAAAIRTSMELLIVESSSGRIDYIAFTDPESLEEIEKFVPGSRALISLAVRFGQTRLIDNTIIAIP